ncbi:MAG TPA: hypothetical protein VK964_07050 [Nocardioidaceae bacterium]|nr:hypothetical protein [Nocardioidaceae bacterium]
MLAGAEAVVAASDASRNLHRLAATVTGPAADTVGGLYVETRTVMTGWRSSWVRAGRM